MTTKNWEFGKCSEPRKLSVFEITIDMKLKKPEGLFSRGEYEELSIKKFVTIYYYYAWKDPNSEEWNYLKIQLLQMKAA